MQVPVFTTAGIFNPIMYVQRLEFLKNLLQLEQLYLYSYVVGQLVASDRALSDTLCIVEEKQSPGAVLSWTCARQADAGARMQGRICAWRTIAACVRIAIHETQVLRAHEHAKLFFFDLPVVPDCSTSKDLPQYLQKPFKAYLVQQVRPLNQKWWENNRHI